MRAIDPSATVRETLDRHPETLPVFVSRGMMCVGCAVAPFETLAEVCALYRLPLDGFLEELEGAARSRPQREGRSAGL